MEPQIRAFVAAFPVNLMRWVNAQLCQRSSYYRNGTLSHWFQTRGIHKSSLGEATPGRGGEGFVEEDKLISRWLSAVTYHINGPSVVKMSAVLKLFLWQYTKAEMANIPACTPSVPGVRWIHQVVLRMRTMMLCSFRCYMLCKYVINTTV